LEDHGPGNDGENSEQDQNTACDPAGFSKDAAKISNKNDREQENDATPQLEIKIYRLQERSTRLQGGQTNEMQNVKNMLPFWIQGGRKAEGFGRQSVGF